MRYKSYLIRPMQHGVSTEGTDFNLPFPYGSWGSKNFRIFQSNPRKRWGYDTADRTGFTGLQQVAIFTKVTGLTRYTLYLTDTDLCEKEAASGKTWSYKTKTITYDTLVESIVTNVVTLSSSEDPATDGVVDGNLFILGDDFTSDEEPHRVVPFDTGDDVTGDTPQIDDTVTAANGATGKIKIIDVTSGTFAGGNAAGDLILTTCSGEWVDDDVLTFTDKETAAVNGTSTATWSTIASASDAAHTITLDDTYPGSKGTGWSGGSRKTCYIRQAYTTPVDERWWYAIVNDTFCFGNGDTAVQKYTGSNYSSDLETGAAFATKARHGIEFANRLVLADCGIVRNPQMVRWSANGVPTDWSVSATAGSTTFLDTKDFITGLGKVGGNLIVYFRNGIRPGYKSGIATAPIQFSIYRGGVGSVAQNGLIEANGTNYFIGRKDIYEMVSDRPMPIGKGIKDKFFTITGHTDVERTIGFELDLINRVCWIANTTEGRLGFAYDYEKKEWDIYQWGNDIVGFGLGGI